MRNKALFTAIGAVCLITAGHAQAPMQGTAQANGLKVEPAAIERNGSSLDVNFTVDYAALRLSTNEQLMLQPVLVEGADTIYMPYLLLAGKTRDKVNHRQAALYGSEPYPQMNNEARLYHSVRVERNRQSQTIRYTASVPYNDRMPGARLELMQTLSGCADCRQKLPSLLIGSVEKAPVEYSPQVLFLTPDVETVKMRKESGEAFLNFLQGQSVILPDLDRNAAELQKINQTVELVVNDKNVTCLGIDLRGYASPEGTYAFNTRLSRARAEALKDYIQKKYPNAGCPFTVETESEDWQGLRRWLVSSSMPYKEQILEIIDSEKNPDARDAKIRQLDGGTAYNRLLKEVYPSLRKVVYVINYSVVPFTVEEGKRVLRTNSKQLSLNEMFLIANTYPRGSREFNEVFVIAVGQFPDDVVANNNAAAVALLQGDTQTARRYLTRIQDTPAAQNNLGVLYLMEGDLPAATDCFRNARASGVPEADANLREIEAKGER